MEYIEWKIFSVLWNETKLPVWNMEKLSSILFHPMLINIMPIDKGHVKIVSFKFSFEQ